MSEPVVSQVRRDVVIDGRRLETVTFTPERPGGATLVLLHEGLGSIALWKSFPEKLALRTGASVLVYSRYGHGRSETLVEKREPDYMHREGDVVLPALLDAFSVDRPVLLGHSDGASIALIFAGACPERCAGLILEAPHIFVEELSVSSIAQAKVAAETGDLVRRLGKYHDDAASMFWGWNDIWLDRRFRDWSIVDYVEKIRCPALLLQGEDDQYGTAAQIEGIIGRLKSSEAHLLPQCRHSPHVDCEETVLALAKEFVQRL